MKILFGTLDIQKALESGNATDAQGDAQDIPIDEDSASDKDVDEYAAAEAEDEIVFKTIPQNPRTNQTRNKS
jgi:hypothetical protein